MAILIPGRSAFRLHPFGELRSQLHKFFLLSLSLFYLRDLLLQILYLFGVLLILNSERVFILSRLPHSVRHTTTILLKRLWKSRQVLNMVIKYSGMQISLVRFLLDWI